MEEIIVRTPVYLPAADSRCRWCGPGRDSYRMIGRCTNCGKSPVLGIFTRGHEARGGVLGSASCPACGVRSLLWQRLAGEHEQSETEEEKNR